MLRRILSLLSVLLCCHFLSAYTAYNGEISFSIHSTLELQDGDYKALNETFSEQMGINKGDYILQQKGLNNLDLDAMSRYCRIILRKEYESEFSFLSNELYRELFGEFSEKEEKEFFDEILSAQSSVIVIKEVLDYGTCEIDGKFAFYYSIRRESTTDKSDVILSCYIIPCGEINYTIECAYRVSDEEYFMPAINLFWDTLRINIVEQGALSEIIIPGTNRSFLWPNSDTNWTVIYSDKDGTNRQLYADRIFTDGYLVTLVLTSFNSSQELSKYLYTVIFTNQIYNAYVQIDYPDKKLIEHKTTQDNIGYLKYSYVEPISELTIYAQAKVFFIDDKHLITLQCEYFEEATPIVEKIFDSFEELSKEK